jgi:hypothetical protein
MGRHNAGIEQTLRGHGNHTAEAHHRSSRSPTQEHTELPGSHKDLTDRLLKKDF